MEQNKAAAAPDAKIKTFASGHERRETGIFHDAKI
jgi:hypothetical protein